MKMSLCTLLLLPLLLLPSPSAGKTDAILRITTTLSLPISPHAAEYLDPGVGGGLSLLLRKHFWPLQMEFEAGYILHALKGSSDGVFRLIPLTLGLHYTFPFRIADKVSLSLFARSGVVLEFLSANNATDINTAFTAGLGSRISLPLSRSLGFGVSVQYMLLSEKDESGSFFHTRIHLDLKL